MRVFRRGLSWMAAAWLICQVGALAAAPIALASAVCGCPLAGLGAACPMHRAHTDAHECVVMNADTVSAAPLVSLMGTIGLVPSPIPEPMIAAASEAVVPASADVDSRSERPDSPPPKGVHLSTLLS
jgi:hypothetical protein